MPRRRSRGAGEGRAAAPDRRRRSCASRSRRPRSPSPRKPKPRRPAAKRRVVADATLLKYEAEAKGIRQVLEAKAQGYQALVQSADNDARAAATLLLTEKLEHLVAMQVEAIKAIKIDKVTVWDAGAGNGNGGRPRRTSWPAWSRACRRCMTSPRWRGSTCPSSWVTRMCWRSWTATGCCRHRNRGARCPFLCACDLFGPLDSL